MKSITDELFAELVSYHLYGNKTKESEERIKTQLTQKIQAVAERNKYRQSKGYKN